jgi:uncharacterized membrane protein (UPF0127 family)
MDVIKNRILLKKFLLQYKNYDKCMIKINNCLYNVLIADNENLRQKGFMNIDYIPKNYGMLFVFDKPQIIGFWMKNVNIPLYILFIDENNKIIHTDNMILQKNVNSDEDYIIYYINKPIKYAIEFNNNISKSDININDYIIFINCDIA